MKIRLVHFLLFLALFLNFSCNQNDLALENRVKSEESIFLNNLNDELSLVTGNENAEKTARVVTVVNPMEEFGLYYQNMLNQLISSEIQNPSIDKIEFDIKVSTYIKENPLPVNLPVLSYTPSFLFKELSKISEANFREENLNIAIAKMELFETTVLNSVLISQNEKMYLLAHSSVLKKTRQTMSARGFANCMDRQMNKNVGENLAVLTDFKNHPGLAIGAWVGLPATIGFGLADGIFNSVRDCL